MTAKQLLNKKIVEIRCEVSNYQYEGSIPLEVIDVEFKLSSGEIISYPHLPEGKLYPKGKFNPKFKKIYPQNLISTWFKSPSHLSKLKGQIITGIWSIEDNLEIINMCSIQFQNGYYLTKGEMSPIGTGGANLFLFKSEEELRNKYNTKAIRIY